MNIFSTNKNIRLVKKVLRQDIFQLDYHVRIKKIREIWLGMVNTTYNSIKDMIVKLQEMKGISKLNFHKYISNYYDEMKHRNFQTEEVPFSKNAQGISTIYHEVLLLMKFLQNKPQVKKMNINYYDLYYTIIKNRDEKKIMNDNENDYNNPIDFITPNHYIGIKPREKIMK